MAARGDNDADGVGIVVCGRVRCSTGASACLGRRGRGRGRAGEVNARLRLELYTRWCAASRICNLAQIVVKNMMVAFSVQDDICGAVPSALFLRPVKIPPSLQAAGLHWRGVITLACTQLTHTFVLLLSMQCNKMRVSFVVNKSLFFVFSFSFGYICTRKNLPMETGEI